MSNDEIDNHDRESQEESALERETLVTEFGDRLGNAYFNYLDADRNNPQEWERAQKEFSFLLGAIMNDNIHIGVRVLLHAIDNARHSKKTGKIETFGEEQR